MLNLPINNNDNNVVKIEIVEETVKHFDHSRSILKSKYGGLS